MGKPIIKLIFPMNVPITIPKVIIEFRNVITIVFPPAIFVTLTTVAGFKEIPDKPKSIIAIITINGWYLISN